MIFDNNNIIKGKYSEKRMNIISYSFNSYICYYLIHTLYFILKDHAEIDDVEFHMLPHIYFCVDEFTLNNYEVCFLFLFYVSSRLLTGLEMKVTYFQAQ